jgi:hypothetical protein
MNRAGGVTSASNAQQTTIIPLPGAIPDDTPNT